MARRSQRDDPEVIRRELVDLLVNFERHLAHSDLRTKVCGLIPANHLLRDLGSSLVVGDDTASARDRILHYMRRHVGIVVHGDELMIVAGISEYARRVRELRVEHGWSIMSGVTVSEMRRNAEEEDSDEALEIPDMKPDEYVLLDVGQDRDGAYRWHVANEIRKEGSLSVRDKILAYLRKNVGKIVNGEELRYVANNKTEWARRTRELRTEFGWPLVTRTNGRPDLPIGTYVLETERQSPPHDRAIKDSVRRKVLQRDGYACRRCEWSHDDWNASDPRHLEAHHIKHHAHGGDNDASNLVTYCNVCHDLVHAEN